MKRIIGGVAYNTGTATMIARSSYDHTKDQGTRGTEVLYQTRGGAFFRHLHEIISYKGREGWQERDQHEFIPMTRDEAAAWATDNVELLADVFGEVPEATAADNATISAVVNVRLPPSLKERIETGAKEKNLSVNSYAMRCFEQFLNMRVIATDLVRAWVTVTELSLTPEAFTKNGCATMAAHAQDDIESALEQLGFNSNGIADISQSGLSDIPNWLGREYEHLREEGWG